MVVQGRWRTLAAKRPIIAQINAESAGAGFRLGEHRHGRIVDMKAFSGEHVATKLGEDSIQSGGASADPIGQRRNLELDPLAGERRAWRFNGKWSTNLPTGIMASRLRPAKPRGIGCGGAGGSVIASQSRPANFSRTRSMTFQRRGSHSSVFDTASPSQHLLLLNSAPTIFFGLGRA